MPQKRTSTKILCFLPFALTPAQESCSISTTEHTTTTSCMNLVPEFLSWIHRGVRVSNLKSRLALSQPGTSTSLEKEKNQEPDILDQGKAPLLFTGRRKIKDLQREACKQQQSRDKSNLLAFRLGRNREVGVPGDLNSFQLWARWWYTMGRSKGEMMGFANSSRCLCLDIRYLTFKFPPPTV